MYEGHWFGGGFMWIFWIVVIVLILWGARSYTDRNGSTQQQSALDILKARYARGEITQKEYETTKRDLLS